MKIEIIDPNGFICIYDDEECRLFLPEAEDIEDNGYFFDSLEDATYFLVNNY